MCYELNGLSREYIMHSHVNLNNVGSHSKISSMHQKFHQWYYVHFLIYIHISYIRKSTFVIGWMKILLTGFIDFWINISQIYQISMIWKKKILAYQTKCDNMFSDTEYDHIFSHFCLSVTNLDYIVFIILCDNHPLTFKTGRRRNLL